MKERLKFLGLVVGEGPVVGVTSFHDGHFFVVIRTLGSSIVKGMM